MESYQVAIWILLGLAAFSLLMGFIMVIILSTAGPLVYNTYTYALPKDLYYVVITYNTSKRKDDSLETTVKGKASYLITATSSANGSSFVKTIADGLYETDGIWGMRVTLVRSTTDLVTYSKGAIVEHEVNPSTYVSS